MGAFDCDCIENLMGRFEEERKADRIQSCVDHINTAVDVDPWARELVAEMGKEILKAQLSKEDTTSDCISRQAAIRWVKTECNPYGKPTLDFESGKRVMEHLKTMPSVQPTYTDAEVQKMQDMHQAEVEKAFELGMEDAKPEIMPDGTLHITVNADVANIDRILLSQEGTHYGDLYCKDDEKPERKTCKGCVHLYQRYKTPCEYCSRNGSFVDRWKEGEQE